MKTLTYLTTLLALIIQVMVNGQTQGNQTRKIRVDIMGPKEPIKMNYVNSNITLSVTEYNKLVEQANVLKINAKQLRDEALSIEQQSLVKQIEASELSAQISYTKFEKNREIIINVFPRIPKNTISSNVYYSYTESEHFMKMAKEMREEGNAQLSIQAKYGNFSNAEEKEALALSKQEEALDLIIKNYPLLLQENQLATNEEKQIKENTITTATLNYQIDNPQEISNTLFAAIEQATTLKTTALELRKTAKTAASNEKQLLINEAISFENDYLLKQVEVSNIKAKMTYTKFSKNKELIFNLIENIKDNAELLAKINLLNTEAEYLLKVGKEMREEGNAQLTLQAKYGALTNAEEKEVVALGKQYESIQTIEKNNSRIVIASR
jgi:hypothetical protein